MTATWPRFLLVAAWIPGVAAGGSLNGRLSLETEYLGESYYSRFVFTGLDLGLPSAGNLAFTQVTQFDDASWLPGPRLELAWSGLLATSTHLSATSSTAVNAERISEEAQAALEVRSADGSRWGLRATGAFHRDERSVVGDGDWETRLEGVRETVLSPGLSGGLSARWEHSRSLGDSSSYLYDYDTGAARLFAAGRTPVGRPWEAWVEGVAKGAESGDVGSYREVRGGAWWRGRSATGELSLDLRYRDYARADTVGRDGFSAELRGRTRLVEWGRSAFDLEGGGIVSQYPEEDDLYVDAVQLLAGCFWRHRIQTWTLTLGPGVDVLEDLHGDASAYRELRLRTGLAGFLGRGGYVDLSADGGYRDYRAEGTGIIQVTALSASYLRSDYWLVDVLVTAGIPLGARVSLEATASASWEFHTEDKERIQITFANLGIGRTF